MKVTVNLEFDTFAEAEKVFRHLGAMDDVKPTPAAHHAPKKAEETKATAHPMSVAPAAASTQAALMPSTAASPSEAAPAATGVTLDDLVAAFQGYLAKGPAKGCTAVNAAAILKAHGVSAIKQAKPEQYAVLKRAFETASPEMPLGEAA